MVSEVGRHRLLSACLVASTLTALVSGSALLSVALAWPLGASWVRATRPASAALLVLLALDASLGLAVALRSAFLALACRARAAPRKVRLLHPVSAHLVCLLLPSVLLNLAVVVWCVVGMALSPRLSRSRLLWAALGYFDEARADKAAARQAMDDTQTTLECCGFDGPADWHPWANDPIGRLQEHDVDAAKEDQQDKALARPPSRYYRGKCRVQRNTERMAKSLELWTTATSRRAAARLTWWSPPPRRPPRSATPAGTRRRRAARGSAAASTRWPTPLWCCTCPWAAPRSSWPPCS